MGSGEHRVQIGSARPCVVDSDRGRQIRREMGGETDSQAEREGERDSEDRVSQGRNAGPCSAGSPQPSRDPTTLQVGLHSD